jgi:hypothetical protein
MFSQNSDGSSSSCSSDDAEEVQRQFFPAFETHDSNDEQQVSPFLVLMYCLLIYSG